GVTENRYYVVVLGLWVFGIMLYFTFKRPLKNIIIPMSLSIIVLLSIYGPISSYSISKVSQNNRLERILEKNGLLNNGIITSNPNVDKDVRNEVSNIISYFYSNHSLEDIKAFTDGYELEDTKELLGFDYSPYYDFYGLHEYINLYVNPYHIPIQVEGYDYFVNMSSWNAGVINVDDLEVQYKNDNILIVE